MSTFMRFLSVALAALLIATTVSAIEQPACYKNVKPWGWGPMPDKTNQSIVQVSGVNTQVIPGFVMPDIKELKELQARFG